MYLWQLVVRERFPQHLVSRFGNLHWTVHSPDLTVYEFFLCDHLRYKVNRRKPRSVNDLKVGICEGITAFSQNTLTKVVQNFEERLVMYWFKERRNLSDVINNEFILFMILGNSQIALIYPK